MLCNYLRYPDIPWQYPTAYVKSFQSPGPTVAEAPVPKISRGGQGQPRHTRLWLQILLPPVSPVPSLVSRKLVALAIWCHLTTSHRINLDPTPTLYTIRSTQASRYLHREPRSTAQCLL